MTSPIAARRMEIFAAERSEAQGFLRLDPSRLRFSLGTSLADLRIPLEITSEARSIMRAACCEVAILLSIQYKRLISGDDLDRLLLREEYPNLPRVVASFGPTGGGQDLKAAAQAALTVHPALSGGILCAWMGPGGRGRSLTGLWIECLRRGFREMAASRDREETPFLVALALGAELEAAAAELRDALPGPPLDRFLGSAAHLAVWVSARTALARAWRDSDRAAADPFLLRLEALLSPFSMSGGRSGLLGSGSTVYGCELTAGIPHGDEIAKQLAAGGKPAEAIDVLTEALGYEKELAGKAEQAVTLARIREMLAAAIIGAEAAGQPGRVAPFVDLYQAPGGLAGVFSDDSVRKALARDLREAASGLVGEQAELLNGAGRAAKSWKAKDPAAAVGIKRADARREYATAAVALLCDQLLERKILQTRRTLTFRTGNEAEGGADAEYEAGRLYRLSTRDGPILKPTVVRPLGHLFADVKDFTRRTGLLGQAAMAEFLRREFYIPILNAAREHYTGMQHLSDRGGIALNNLLGDAISFSGDIEAMVALAQAIRGLLSEYEARLAREVSSEAVAKQTAAIEERYHRDLAGAAQRSAGAREELARTAVGTPEHEQATARLAWAATEEMRLALDRERARSMARGEGLEAGVFIAFGPVPLVVTIDDDVFGKNRVAIAEKINESARGTARAGSARVMADAHLAAERAAQKNPALSHAWSVFIGHPFSLSLPRDVELRAVRAVRSGDLAVAMRSMAVPVREALEALARSDEQTGDIYNSGAALSEEALMAFLASVEGTRAIRRVDLQCNEIAETLRQRWFFGSGTETLIVTFKLDGSLGEMFRRAGRASFKGLGEVVVWELCLSTGGPGALAEAFGASWLKGVA